MTRRRRTIAGGVPITLLEGLAGTALRVLPTVLAELREIRPDLIVHDSLSRRFPHVGPRSYISPTATLPDGRSYLDRTAATVIALIRSHYRVAGLP